MVDEVGEEKITLRRYLTTMALLQVGTDVFTAVEAVSSTAIEHPEWNLDELDTWAGWEARGL